MIAAILGAPTKTCSIPALKDDKGTCITLPKDKANLFATTFKAKNVLPDKVEH